MLDVNDLLAPIDAHAVSAHGSLRNHVQAAGRISRDEQDLVPAQTLFDRFIRECSEFRRLQVAEQSGTTERFDLFERIRHVRLPLGDRFSNEVLALGMLYYRLRDWL